MLRVRAAGDPTGPAVLHFHGTPSSRLEVAFGDEIAERLGVRLVAFDRPGYGGSTPARFSLASVARDAEAVADALGLGSFATSGQSGGGPFAVAAAAVLGDRVTRVGVMSGAGPFQQVPGGVEGLDEVDAAALAMLPGDPEAAARHFATPVEPLVEALARDGAQAAEGAFGDLLSPRDAMLVAQPRWASALAAGTVEALRQGATGYAWDNVSWIGTWDVDPTTVTCPVLLWYGDEDRFADLSHGRWYAENLPDATLTIRPGEGHFGMFEHLEQMLRDLTASR